MAAAIALGVGGVGGVIGFAAGTAGAVTTNYSAHFKATSATTVVATGSGQAGGNLKIYTMQATGPSNTITLTATATAGTVDWASAGVTASTGHATYTSGIGTDAINIKVTRVAGETESISITGITYTTTSVAGSVTVTATNTVTTTKIYVFHPVTVQNATGPKAPPVSAHKGTLVTTGKKTIGRGSGLVAGTLVVTLKATTAHATTAVKEGWSTGTHVTLKLHTATQCTTTTEYVLYTGAPKATVTAKTTSTTPTVSVTLLTVSPCSGISRNDAKLVFTNSGYFTSKTGKITVTLSGIKYVVGPKTASGTVTVTGATVAGVTTFTPHTAKNATIRTIFVTADTPAVTVEPTGFDAKISPINIAEQTTGAVSYPYVCITLKHTAAADGTFDSSVTATVKVTKGNAIVTSKVTYKNAGGATPTGTSAKFAIIHVKTSSTKETSTFEISGLAVNATSTPGAVTAVLTMGSSSTDCTSDTVVVGSATAYVVSSVTTQIYGSTPDATAAAELEHIFPVHGYYEEGGVYESTASYDDEYYTHLCPGTAVYNNEYELGNPSTENRPVVLATTKTFADALSSQYLASFLETGTLLTPTTSLAPATVNALRVEGISHVYVVGGPLAITTTVVDQLETTPVYNCGGTAIVTKTGRTTYIQVTRLYGQTQYDTAATVAEYVGGKTATFSFRNAYSGTNKTGGNGMYNDTAGKASTHASSGAKLETAILASGKEFQDAEAASTLSYTLGIPLLLTTPAALSTAAKTAMLNLHVSQVILMGGPLAVTNTVVTALEKMTVSVLRIAGKTYADTAVQLAKFELGTNSAGTGVYDVESKATGRYFYDYLDVATVARGNGFTDGLAGALDASEADTYYIESDYSGTYTFYNYFEDQYAMPLLLTLSPTTVGAPLTTFLKSVSKTSTASHKIESLEFLGGPLSITPTEIHQMDSDVG